jgi:hypothetical protein
MKEKFILTGACISGVSAVAYGMAGENNTVFGIGILIIIAAYLGIRKKLKAALRDKTSG